MVHKPKSKTIKLLKENIGENLYELGYANEFLGTKKHEVHW